MYLPPPISIRLGKHGGRSGERNALLLRERVDGRPVQVTAWVKEHVKAMGRSNKDQAYIASILERNKIDTHYSLALGRADYSPAKAKSSTDSVNESYVVVCRCGVSAAA